MKKIGKIFFGKIFHVNLKFNIIRIHKFYFYRIVIVVMVVFSIIYFS